MKVLSVIAIVSLIAVSCNQEYQVTTNDWPQYKNDNYRSGRSPIAVFDKTFGQKWVNTAPQVPSPAWYGPAKEDAYALSGPLPSMRDYDLAYSPIIVNGLIYYGSSADDALHCLNAETGEEEWIYITDGPIRIGPTYLNGSLYFGSDDGYAYSIDASSGELNWKFSPSGSKKKLLNNNRLISFWPIRTGVLIEDGIAYFGASLLPWKKSYLCAIDAESGDLGRQGTYVKELENVTFEGSMVSSGDRLIQPQGRVSPVFINRGSGKIEGRLPGSGGCFVLVTPDNHIIHPQTSRYISIEETVRGQKKPDYMSFKGGKEMVVAGQSSYVLSDHSISAYNRKTNEVIWVNGNYNAHRIIMADTVLFAGATDTVYAVSISSGRPLWKGKVEGTVYAMAAGDSALFVSTNEGKIYCFSKGFSAEQKLGKNQNDPFLWPEEEKNSKPLNIKSGPYVDYIDQHNILLRFNTFTPEKCRVYWKSNGNFERAMYKDDSAKKDHKYTIPVRKDFIYKYRITSGAKISPVFEHDNFFNFSPQKIALPENLFKDKNISHYVDDIIGQMDREKGLCLILGFSGTQLPLEIAQKTLFDMIVLDDSPKKIDEFRNQLQKEGVYGHRISAYTVDDLNKTLLQSDIADLLICSGYNNNFDEIARLTAPYGKAVYITGNNENELWELIDKKMSASEFDWQVDETVVKLGSKLAVILTKKEPQSAGVWTHQYGKPDNSSFGGENMWGSTSSDEFEVQWMGRPGPRFQTDRNGRKPAPLAINGKLFVQGNQRIAAINAYNGTVLWSMDIPGMLRMNVNHDCSNWAADEKQIYTIVKDKLLIINQEDGNIEKELDVPTEVRSKFDWEYIAASDGMFVVSLSPKNSNYTDYYGGYGWYDAVKGPTTDKVMSAALYAYQAGNDQLKWKYEYRHSMIINPTIIIYDKKIFFVESHSTFPLTDKKRGSENIFKKLFLVSLNIKDGSLNWRKAIDNVPGIAAYYMAAGSERIVIESSYNGKYYLYNYKTSDGGLVWKTDLNWFNNNHGGHLSIPAIAGNRLMVKPALYNLRTGERLSYDVPKAGHGCASYALSEQSVFYRGGSITQFNFDTRMFSKWERLRPDCWISTVPALGMVLSPEGGGGCSCGNWFETSMVMAPKSRAPFMFKFNGPAKFIDSLNIELVLKKDVIGKLYYTTDGSEPGKKSLSYIKPVLIDKNTLFRAMLYYEKDG
ncbi:PQQ-binding-like beta-propeller repeat protein, partial [bacterium]|nr:PQQ-binding-like beta-propeller repeat protein [bacterium]